MSVSVLAPSFQSVPFILLSAFFTLDGSLSLLHCRSDNLRADLDCDERPNGFFLTNVPDGEEVLEEYFSSGLKQIIIQQVQTINLTDHKVKEKNWGKRTSINSKRVVNVRDTNAVN